MKTMGLASLSTPAIPARGQSARAVGLTTERDKREEYLDIHLPGVDPESGTADGAGEGSRDDSGQEVQLQRECRKSQRGRHLNRWECILQLLHSMPARRSRRELPIPPSPSSLHPNYSNLSFNPSSEIFFLLFRLLGHSADK